MADESPSNAVLLAKLDNLKEVVLSNQTSNHEALTAVIVQTTKTNGRLTSLERVKNMMMGALVFLNVIVVPIILAVIFKYLSNIL